MRTLPKISKTSFALGLFLLLAPLALPHCAARGGELGDGCMSDSDCEQPMSCRAIGGGSVLQCTASCNSDSDCSGLPISPSYFGPSTPSCVADSCLPLGPTL
jgi:hypothetical protein